MAGRCASSTATWMTTRAGWRAATHAQRQSPPRRSPSPLKTPAPRARSPPKERKNLSPLRSRLARCEKRMTELASAAQELDAQLTDPALYESNQRERQMELHAQRARIAQETEQVETEWLESANRSNRPAAKRPQGADLLRHEGNPATEGYIIKPPVQLALLAQNMWAFGRIGTSLFKLPAGTTNSAPLNCTRGAGPNRRSNRKTCCAVSMAGRTA